MLSELTKTNFLQFVLVMLSPLVHRIQHHVDRTATASAPSAFPSLNFFSIILDFGNSPW